MSRTLRPAALLGAVLGVLLAAPAFGYTIILKGGARVLAKEKPTIQGQQVVFITKIGVVQSIPIADYDAAKTEAANKLNAGDAYVLDTSGERKVEADPGQGKKPNLSEYIRQHKATNLVLKDQEAGPKAAPGARNDSPSPLEKSLSAGPDAAPVDPVVNDTFLRALETAGIRGPHIVSMAKGVRITAIADTEQQVFGALGGIARGLKESRAAGRTLEKAEVFLNTTSGQPAGHFDMSADDADALLNGKVSVAKYFVASVIF
jgi:hypothetical protein